MRENSLARPATERSKFFSPVEPIRSIGCDEYHNISGLLKTQETPPGEKDPLCIYSRQGTTTTLARSNLMKRKRWTRGHLSTTRVERTGRLVRVQERQV